MLSYRLNPLDSMEEQHTQALILKCTPYGENDRIATLFTPHLGKLSAYIKAAPFLQPLSLIEALIQPGKRDLYRLTEPRLVNGHLRLRDTFPCLKASMEIADFITRFFPEGIEKPHIFHLATAYFQKLPASKNPETFYFSFLLKTLHVEGLIDPGQIKEHLAPLIISRKWDEIDTLQLTTDEKEELLLLEHG